jgi:hypothetical protein
MCYRIPIACIISHLYFIIIKSRCSAVGIAPEYGLNDQGVGVRVPVGLRMLISPYSQDRLWGPPSLLSNGYRGLIPRGKAAGA